MGGNPTMDLHSVLWGVAIPLGMLHAKAPGISSGRLGLWLVCAFTPIICGQSAYKINRPFERLLKRFER